eukprot:IDg9300t1
MTTKGNNFKPDDDLALAKSWPCFSRRSVDQNAKMFWSDVADAFAKQLRVDTHRRSRAGVDSIKSSDGCCGPSSLTQTCVERDAVCSLSAPDENSSTASEGRGRHCGIWKQGRLAVAPAHALRAKASRSSSSKISSRRSESSDEEDIVGVVGVVGEG